MAIARLKPFVVKPEPVKTPQCSVVVPANSHFDEWRKGRYQQLRPHMKPEQCQRESVVQIDGKHYCRIHAGKLALDLWLSGKLVEKTA